MRHPRLLGLLLVLGLLGLTACTRFGPSPTPTSTLTPSPEPMATLTPSPTPTRTPTATPTATLTPTSTPGSPLPTPPEGPLRPPRSPVETPTPYGVDAVYEGLVDPPPLPLAETAIDGPPPRQVPNARRTFWVTDGETGERREILARLRVQTSHAAMWVEEGVWHDLRALEAAATRFELAIYPMTRAAFGSERTPGVDNDPRIHILHATGLGRRVVATVSGLDLLPRTARPSSNQAEMITFNLDQVEPASPLYNATLAQQFQRLIQLHQDRNEARWLKEGLAELAIAVNGLGSGRPERAYLADPDVPLTAWGDEWSEPQRGAAYLFCRYVYERFGEPGIRALTAQPLNGMAGVEAALAELTPGLTVEELFAQWLRANYGGDYETLSLDRPALAAAYDAYPVSIDGTVHQFGADYVGLQGKQDLTVRFSGQPTVTLLSVPPHDGRFWWSGRPDFSRVTLTRTVDLAGVDDAALRYWTWYELERGYDYATLELSTDGGAKWQSLQTPGGTDADPHGNNPGWGYTGQSGGWVEEQVDLTPYVGQEVTLRFAVWTDEAVAGRGFLLDDIAIPEIDFADDAESEAGWSAAGFVRTSDEMAQQYLVVLIRPGDELATERLPVAPDGSGEWTISLAGEAEGEAVIALSGLVPFTTHLAVYQMVID